MVRGRVSQVSTYKGNQDGKMTVEFLEPEKTNAMALDKRDVVVMGAEEFVKLAEVIPAGALDVFIKPTDDFGKEE